MGSILVVAEIQNGQIREASYELVAFAQDAASASGRDVASLVMGKDVSGLADELAKKGGGTVHLADDEILANYGAEAAAAAESCGDLLGGGNPPTGQEDGHRQNREACSHG